MTYHVTHTRRRKRALELLARDPQASEEKASGVSFLPGKRQRGVGHLCSDQRFRPEIDAFTEDHKGHFRVKSDDRWAVIGGIIVLISTLWFIGIALAHKL